MSLDVQLFATAEEADTTAADTATDATDATEFTQVTGTQEAQSGTGGYSDILKVWLKSLWQFWISMLVRCTTAVKSH